MVALICGCGGRGTGSDDTPRSEALSEVHLRCDGEHTHLEAQEVRASADGVHVLIRNSAGAPLVLNYSVDDGMGGGGDTTVPPGTSEQLVPFVARTVGFKCLREEEDDEILDFALDFETVTVVGPPGVAKTAELECGATGRAEAPRPSAGSITGDDPVRAVTSYLRGGGLLGAGDRIEPAVSPGPEFPIVRWVHGGRVIGAFWFSLNMEGKHTYSLDAVELCDIS